MMQTTAALQKKEHNKSVEPALSNQVDSRVDLKEERGTEAGMPLFLQRFAASSLSTPPPIQRQPLEEEEEAIQTKADAFSIQRQPVKENEEELLQTNPTNKIQRQSIEEEEEETVQSKTDVPPIQRQTIEEEEIKTKPSVEQITPLIQRQIEGEEEPIQTKLTIGHPNDKYEQEADRVAEQVMRMPEPLIQQKPT